MKRLIRILLLVLAVSAGTAAASAQQRHCPDNSKRLQFVTKQATLIAEKLGLNDTQRARFIETFTNCQKEMWTQCPPPGRPGADKHCHATESQADSAMQARFDHHQKMLDLRKKYHAQYSEFMTPKQIERSYQLERQMMERLRKRHEDRQCRDRENKRGKQPRAPKSARQQQR